MAQANSLMSPAPTMRPRALERVERAAHADERLGLERVLLPGGEQLADARDLFARLFYIESEQLGIDLGGSLDPIGGCADLCSVGAASAPGMTPACSACARAVAPASASSTVAA